LVTVPGIDVNLRDTKGCTALFFSAIRNYPEVAAALIEAGVDPSIRSYPPPGRSLDATSGALDLAVQFDSHSALSAIIFTAAKKGITVDPKYTASLLIGELDGDCDIEVFKRAFELYPNLASFRLMPILEAATELQSVEIVKLLLEKGSLVINTADWSCYDAS
jgi:ankyrin repeat protein